MSSSNNAAPSNYDSDSFAKIKSHDIELAEGILNWQVGTSDKRFVVRKIQKSLSVESSGIIFFLTLYAPTVAATLHEQNVARAMKRGRRNTSGRRSLECIGSPSIPKLKELALSSLINWSESRTEIVNFIRERSIDYSVVVRTIKPSERIMNSGKDEQHEPDTCVMTVALLKSAFDIISTMSLPLPDRRFILRHIEDSPDGSIRRYLVGLYGAEDTVAVDSSTLDPQLRVDFLGVPSSTFQRLCQETMLPWWWPPGEENPCELTKRASSTKSSRGLWLRVRPIAEDDFKARKLAFDDIDKSKACILDLSRGKSFLTEAERGAESGETDRSD